MVSMVDQCGGCLVDFVWPIVVGRKSVADCSWEEEDLTRSFVEVYQVRMCSR